MDSTFTVIALGVTGLAGMAGWFFAWMARGDTIGALKAAGGAQAGELAAKELTVEANAALATATVQLGVARQQAATLQTQLDSARASNQTLVDALAKAGVPVAPVVLDDALGKLYPDGDAGGAGAGPHPSGGGSVVPTQPIPVARTTTRK